MPRFLFTYRVPNIPLEQRLAELGPSAGAGTMALWHSWQCPFLEKGGGVEVGVIPEQVVP
jgi:hypothetical protein